MFREIKHQVPLRELKIGDEFEGVYLLQGFEFRSTSKGRHYMTGILCDQSCFDMGDGIKAIMWDNDGDIGSAEDCQLAKITGRLEYYHDDYQVKIINFVPLDDGYTIQGLSLIPAAPIDAVETYNHLLQIIHSIEDEDYRKVVETIIAQHETEFRDMPAGKQVHHAFLHGLLMHTESVVRLACVIAEQYGDVVDRDLLVAGACLHDIGKVYEYKLWHGLGDEYTVNGNILGHTVMGATEVIIVARELSIPEDKASLLQHMILSHHGEPEHGAAVPPCCIEAELLAAINKMDSRVGIYISALKQTQRGTCSQKISVLGRRIYNHSMPTHLSNTTSEI